MEVLFMTKKSTEIPLMYHPTNVVILDDDPKILTDLSLVLAHDIPYVVNNDPQKIMQYLKTHVYHPDTLSALITQQTFDNPEPSTQETFAIDYSRLPGNLEEPTRFKKSLHIMIDRAMKKIDGLEFCSAVREENWPVHLTLFTGQTTDAAAVQAFNQKIIDGFLVKEGDYAKVAVKINNLIRENTWQQFVNLGIKLAGPLLHLLKPLRDEQFVKVFMQIYEKYKIVEFYLLDSSCSFLLIDADGHAKHFFVRNDADFVDCYEIAKNSEATHKILEAIRGRQMFPYTKEVMGYAELQGEQWESDGMMVEMHKVPGRELYYTVVNRPDIKVFSFNRYLQEEWPKP